MDKILVAGKRLNLGVTGPGELPSWGRQDRVVPGVATSDESRYVTGAEFLIDGGVAISP